MRADMIYDPTRLLLIAGPCSLENMTVARTVAVELARLRDKHKELNIVFKGSFDKANRTSGGGKRAPSRRQQARRPTTPRSARDTLRKSSFPRRRESRLLILLGFAFGKHGFSE